ncbi:MAG: acyl-CoA dehydratase activase [Thermodesulfobacteriota bacterium]|nr:acyl-CoA dehydratase activase [Thermodesulfobacteriota bacterium]
MYFAGIDLGSRKSKIAVFDDDKLIEEYVGETGLGAARTAEMIMSHALADTGLRIEDFQSIVATGYGRVVVPFAHSHVSDILAHAMGAFWYFPSARTVLDLGGQDCKAINVDERGRLTGFIMNDKCASGNGRFLETMADLLEIPIEKTGDISLESQKPVIFSTICAVFAKSEALAILRKGIPKSDILAGIHHIMAVQCEKMLEMLSLQEDLVMSGGISKNIGVVKMVTKRLGITPKIPADPQMVGAVGAAVVARKKYLRDKKVGAEKR